MNSEDLKTYKCVKISKSNFCMIIILSLHSMRSTSKNEKQFIKRSLSTSRTSTIYLFSKQQSFILTYRFNVLLSPEMMPQSLFRADFCEKFLLIFRTPGQGTFVSLCSYSMHFANDFNLLPGSPMPISYCLYRHTCNNI